MYRSKIGINGLNGQTYNSCYDCGTSCMGGCEGDCSGCTNSCSGCGGACSYNCVGGAGSTAIDPEVKA